MDFLFDPEWVQRIIAFLFPYPFPPACNLTPGVGCLPGDVLGQ